MIMARFLALPLMVVMSMISHSSAYVFYVGGSRGWVPDPSQSYNSWAQRTRYQVNDSLVFRYNKESDSVLVVTKDDYDSCNTSNPIQKYEDGNSEIKFDRSGSFFFISGAPGNCEKGQKLIVVVLAVRNNKGQIAPAPKSSPPSPSGSPISPSKSSPPSSSSPPVPPSSPPTASRAPSPVSLSPSFPPIASPSPVSLLPPSSPPTASLAPSPTSLPPSSSPAVPPSTSPVPSSSSPSSPPTPSSLAPSPSTPAGFSPASSPSGQTPRSSPASGPPSPSPASGPPSPPAPPSISPSGSNPASGGSSGNETSPPSPAPPSPASWVSAFFIGLASLLAFFGSF